ncbi:MAG: alpha/beta hydrolase [Cyclobacteriaceae bacterium]|nr:alpha/beta hydrolase [Cyclobacteriaceae bacterium]
MKHIFFYETGSGFPLIFLHGFCESSDIWMALSEELSDRYRIICPDLPGFGQSPLPEEPFSLQSIGDGLVAWLKNMDIDQCIVIGHSLGGYISLEILRKHPDFVAGIGLLNSSAFGDSQEKKDNRNKLIEFIDRNGVEPFINTFVPSLFYPPTIAKHQETLESISSKAMDIDPQSVMQYAAAMRERPDSVDLLHKYRDRIMLIAGEFDQNVPLEKSLQMKKILDDDNVSIVPDSAHMSLFEQSEMCYGAIRKFAGHLTAQP